MEFIETWSKGATLCGLLLIVAAIAGGIAAIITSVLMLVVEQIAGQDYFSDWMFVWAVMSLVTIPYYVGMSIPHMDLGASKGPLD